MMGDHWVDTSNAWVIARTLDGRTTYWRRTRHFQQSLIHARRFPTAEAAEVAYSQSAELVRQRRGRTYRLPSDAPRYVGPVCPSLKRGYRTQRQAISAMLSHWQGGLTQTSRSYQCPDCSYWHLTSQSDDTPGPGSP